MCEATATHTIDGSRTALSGSRPHRRKRLAPSTRQAGCKRSPARPAPTGTCWADTPPGPADPARRSRSRSRNWSIYCVLLCCCIAVGRQGRCDANRTALRGLLCRTLDGCVHSRKRQASPEGVELWQARVLLVRNGSDRDVHPELQDSAHQGQHLAPAAKHRQRPRRAPQC